MPGIRTERSLYQVSFLADSRTATGILYNDNAAASATAVGIDTRDFDEATIILNAGTAASAASVAFALYDNDLDNSSTSTAITGADLTTVTSATDEAIQIAHLNCKSTKRYLYLRSNKTLNTNAADWSAVVELSRADANPQSNSPVFTV